MNALRFVEIIFCLLLATTARGAGGLYVNEVTTNTSIRNCTVCIKSINISRSNNTRSHVYSCGFNIEISTAERAAVRIDSLDIDYLFADIKFFSYDTKNRHKTPFVFPWFYDKLIRKMKFSTYRISPSKPCSVTVWKECAFPSLAAIPSELEYTVAYNNDRLIERSRATGGRVIFSGNGLTSVTKPVFINAK